MATNSYTIEVKSKKPFVVLDLKKYETLLEYLEDIEDRLAVKQSEDEPVFDFKQLLKKLDKKKGIKRKL